jgi:hypothetical protein
MINDLLKQIREYYSGNADASIDTLGIANINTEMYITCIIDNHKDGLTKRTTEDLLLIIEDAILEIIEQKDGVANELEQKWLTQIVSFTGKNIL